MFLSKSNKRKIIRAAVLAGESLYGEDLVWRSSLITCRGVSTRVKAELLAGCAEECCMHTDTYEYAFFMDGTGVDCADELVLQDRLMCGGYILLYCPECGIDVLRVDCTQEALVDLVREFDFNSV